MSYDLYVFRVPAGAEANEVFDQEMTIEEEDGPTTADAELDRCHAEIGQALGDAASCHRSGRHVSINIPFHYEGTQARLVFGKLAKCLHEARVRSGLTIYDPQEGRAIDPVRDLNSMLAGNERGTKIVPQLRERPTASPASATRTHPASKPTKPWWRFW